MIIELIGILGSVFVLLSMLFNTDTRKGALVLRYLNNIGSILFIWYGVQLHAWSMAILNLILFIVNCYYIVKLHKNRSKDNTK